MLDSEAFERFQRDKSPVLFHVTTAPAVSAILRAGLRPAGERNARMWNDFFATRSGHVYLAGQGDLPVIQVGGEPRVLAIHLSELDARLVDPDEDIVAHHLAFMVDVTPPQREMIEGVEAPGQRGGLAAWADATPGFDRSEVTERSLFEHRRIAYRGTIPPEAIQVVDARSQPIAAFIDGAFPTPGALRPAPPAGMALTEAARARVLAAYLISALMEVAGVDGRYDVRDHASAAATADDLRRRASEMRRGRLEEIRRSTIVSAAARIADAASELDLDAAKLALDSATSLASTAANELGALISDQLLQEKQGRALVNEAIRATERVPWETGFTQSQLQ